MKVTVNINFESGAVPQIFIDDVAVGVVSYSHQYITKNGSDNGVNTLAAQIIMSNEMKFLYYNFVTKESLIQ